MRYFLIVFVLLSLTAISQVDKKKVILDCTVVKCLKQRVPDINEPINSTAAIFQIALSMMKLSGGHWSHMEDHSLE